MKQRSFALRGDLCWSRDARHLNTVKDGWLVCVDGRSAGVFETLPEQYAGLPREDWSGRLAVFSPGGSEPLRVYEVYTRLLPEPDVAALQEGIPVESEERLDRLLEDFGA